MDYLLNAIVKIEREDKMQWQRLDFSSDPQLLNGKEHDILS